MSHQNLKSARKRSIQRLSRWFDQHSVPESAVIMLSALVVGVGAGLGAVAFRRLIDGVRNLAFGGLGGLLEPIAPFHLLIIPAVGGLLVGLLVYHLAHETRGSGVPEIIESVALRGGRIRPRVIIVKALASAICIGSGGSAGREGPIAYIGSALGSTLGQLLKLSDERIRNLVACGVAGAVAATFNAPIAGALFALEVVLGKLHATSFGAVVISAVTADVVGYIFEGDLRAFAIPEYTLLSPWELVLYALLGVVAAVASIGFSQLLYLSTDLWDRLRIPEYYKPALGGVLLGVIGILTFQTDGFPRVFGVGYSSITEALFNKLTLNVIVALFIIKMLATVLTLGSGGSGGIFAPSLFMGAMMGAAFGQIAHRLFPTITAPAGAYALVGMAAFFSGAAHAPASAILILFEMTGEYSIIPPLMLATVMSTFISRIISSDSVYTLKLSRRGVYLGETQDSDVMRGVTVAEVMATNTVLASLEMPLEKLEATFIQSHRNGLAVVDKEGNLIGIVCIRDLERASSAGPIAGKTVADIATTENLLTVTPDEPMWVALRRLGGRNIGHLPVVEGRGSRRLVGMVYRRGIIRAYNRAITKQAHHQHRDETLRLDKLDDAGFAQITVTPDAPVVGLRIREVDWPDESLIVSVRRGGKLYVARSYTSLQAQDQVTVFANNDCLPIVRQYLSGSRLVQREKVKHQARHREFTISAGGTCSGRQVQELSLPPECVLVSIRRGDEVIIPHRDTILQAGDVVEVFGLEADLKAVGTCLTK